MGLIYVDSCLVIYAFEDESARGDRVRKALAEATGHRFVISPLVALECLVKPARDNDPVLRYYYEDGLPAFEQVALDDTIFRRAAELRGRLGLRTPDALHLAAAQAHGCEALWTNDDRLAAASRGLAVNVV